MTTLALTMILAAAFVHATWNLLVKRAAGGLAFMWLFSAAGVVLYAPVCLLVFIIIKPQLGPEQFLFMGGTAVLHLVYFVLLQRGYRVGDLSLVYPLARGTGPALSTSAAILFLGERPGWLALIGAVLVGLNVFILTGGQRKGGGSARQAVLYGLMTGFIIALYTLWDKHAVSVLLIPPVMQDYSSTIGRTLLLTPYAARHPVEVLRQWQTHRFEVLAVGLLGSLSYILVLTALVFTPVSYVAPAREISILIGTVMGTRLLAEGFAGRRIVASVGMVAGVVALAVG